MATKTYLLMSHMDADAPVYQTTADGQRSQVKKIPFHHVPRRYAFSDKDGVGRVIRYLANSKFIDQDKQIELEKIPANEPFSSHEKKDLEFRFAALTTNKLRAQEYLEATPEFKGFQGHCDLVREPTFELLDAVNDAKIKNQETRERIKAASKIYDLDLEAAKGMLIRLNGSFFETPYTIEECQNMLIAFVDDADDAGLKAVLKDDSENTEDEKITVLIGKLLSAELLSFDITTGEVKKKDKTGNWIDVKEIQADSLDEVKRLFSEYLLSNKGKNLLADLEKDLSTYDKSKNK